LSFSAAVFKAEVAWAALSERRQDKSTVLRKKTLDFMKILHLISGLQGMLSSLTNPRGAAMDLHHLSEDAINPHKTTISSLCTGFRARQSLLRDEQRQLAEARKALTTRLLIP
jgi:hypothetical protein